MRASLTVLLTLALTACSQAPVQPASAAAPGSAQSAAAAAAAPSAPPPVCPTPAPVTQPFARPLVRVEKVPVDKDHPLVKIQTNLGDIVVQLDGKRAPRTVKSFLTYVGEHYYDNSGFYRVIPGFVIQGGDYTPALKYHAPKHPPIPDEAGNGLSNLRGSIAMARDDDPYSGNATFFINHMDNQKLDPRADRWGYAVFGQVVEGMDVVDKIAAMETHSVTLDDKYHEKFDDVPVQPVQILKVTLLPLDIPAP